MSDVPLITGTSSLDLLTEAGLSATAPLTISSRPFFWQQIERIRAALAICDSVAAIRHARVTLTDAQIKALPTTPITLVSAPAAGLAIVPILANLRSTTSAGAYTNINAAGELHLRFSASGQGFGYVPNDAAIANGSTTRLTALLGSTTNKRVTLIPQQDTENVDDWGPIAPILTASDVEATALAIAIDNGGSGVLTGGNAVNTLRVDVLYIVL